MIPAGTIAVLVTAWFGGINLLTNPGFEQRNGDAPVAWSRYVQPQPGAVGRLDADAHAGDSAVLLHTPLPYAKDPVNNWSQNVYGEFSGKAFEARAYIRTVDAGQAALWVQCWRRGQRFPHAVFTSADHAPLRGTHPWGEVALRFTVPSGTDFLTLRCVLLGTGTAWFDEVYLGEASKGPSETVGVPEPPPVEVVTVAAPGQDFKVLELRAEIEKLKQSHLVLAGTVEDLRQQVRELQAAARAAQEPPTPQEPLVDRNK